jgi:hypothetical protein
MFVHEDLVAHRDDLLTGHTTLVGELWFDPWRYGSSPVVHLRADLKVHHWMFLTEHLEPAYADDPARGPERRSGAPYARPLLWRAAELCRDEPRAGLQRLPQYSPPSGPFAHLGSADPIATDGRRLCRRCTAFASILLARWDERGGHPHWWHCRACYEDHVEVSLADGAHRLELLLGDLAAVRATALPKPLREQTREVLRDLARESVDPRLLDDLTELRPSTLWSLCRGIHPSFCLFDGTV